MNTVPDFFKWMVLLNKTCIYKTSSNNRQNSCLSVDNLASYIFTQMCVSAIIPDELCGRCTSMFVDTELCAIQSWKHIIWQHTKLLVTYIKGATLEQLISSLTKHIYNNLKLFPSTSWPTMNLEGQRSERKIQNIIQPVHNMYSYYSQKCWFILLNGIVSNYYIHIRYGLISLV
jgi:hypothetical protein